MRRIKQMDHIDATNVIISERDFRLVCAVVRAADRALSRFVSKGTPAWPLRVALDAFNAKQKGG